jgi:hypothetical protein
MISFYLSDWADLDELPAHLENMAAAKTALIHSPPRRGIKR